MYVLRLLTNIQSLCLKDFGTCSVRSLKNCVTLASSASGLLKVIARPAFAGRHHHRLHPGQSIQQCGICIIYTGKGKFSHLLRMSTPVDINLHILDYFSSIATKRYTKFSSCTESRDFCLLCCGNG